VTVRSRLRWLGVVILALLLGASLLYHYRAQGVVATLDRADGTVERDYAAAPGQFEPAASGSRFRVGDAVRTRHGATAAVRLGDGSHVALDQDTLLRFLATPPEVDAQGLDVEAGSATLATGKAPLDLYTHLGLARLEPGTSVAIQSRAAGVRFAVQVGLARFETKEGTRTVDAGGEITIDIGGAVIEAASKNVEASAREAGEREPFEDEPGSTISVIVDGKGTTVRAATESSWRPLAPGKAELAPGSSLQIAAGCRVMLNDEGGSVSLQGKGQYIVGAPGAPFVQTAAGRLFIDRGRTQMSLAVPGGSITVRPWSKGEAAVDAPRTTFAVSSGSAELLGALGRGDVRAGESATLLSSGRLEFPGRGPSYADMVAAAGSSFVVHDPDPPTSVGFLLKDTCPMGGVVERLALARSRVVASARGDESANLLLAKGTHRYQVRCVGRDGALAGPSASGVVTILQDSGTGVLSKVPPMTRIDTDGRSYTVTYQNLLPEIVVRWPTAPAASSYTLTLDSRGGVSSHQASQPTLIFKAGQIKEGRYTLTFSAGGRSSAPTKLAIMFDNAAPAARIQSPKNGSFQPGSAVDVAGVAVPGWVISVAGRELAMDDQARFSEQVTASSAQQTLQLSFTHPRRGAHYYLRHAAEAAR
jgi:hypothetical protein